jgi:hypothetical protein
MPLNWTIDSQRRIVDVVAQDEVVVTDVMAFFDAIEDAAALPYKTLIDGSRGRATMSNEDMMALVVRIRQQHRLSMMGPLAIVVSPEQAQQFARVLGAAAVADRPMKVFDELRPARRWLEAQLPAWP